MNPMAKYLISIGTIFIITGLLWQFGILQTLKLGRLPGDIIIERPNTKIYIPIVTCLILSAIFSLIGLIFRK